MYRIHKWAGILGLGFAVVHWFTKEVVGDVLTSIAGRAGRVRKETFVGVLDVLREAGVTATFFLIDDRVTAETAPIVRRMFDEGHAVALHSDTRALMFKTPEALASALTRQRERMVGSSRPGCDVTSRKSVRTGGSSSDFSRALAEELLSSSA